MPQIQLARSRWQQSSAKKGNENALNPKDPSRSFPFIDKASKKNCLFFLRIALLQIEFKLLLRLKNKIICLLCASLVLGTKIKLLVRL